MPQYKWFLTQRNLKSKRKELPKKKKCKQKEILLNVSMVKMKNNPGNLYLCLCSYRIIFAARAVMPFLVPE